MVTLNDVQVEELNGAVATKAPTVTQANIQ